MQIMLQPKHKSPQSRYFRPLCHSQATRLDSHSPLLQIADVCRHEPAGHGMLTGLQHRHARHWLPVAPVGVQQFIASVSWQVQITTHDINLGSQSAPWDLTHSSQSERRTK